MRAALILLLCSTAFAFAPEPQFIPVPQFVPIPRFAELPKAAGSGTETAPEFPMAPVADEPAPVVVPQSPKILRWERRCGPDGCTMVPIYEETPDQAAQKLTGWKDLPEAEAKRLAAIVDAPEVKKARAGHWDPGTCEMLCTIPAHGTHWTWDDPVDDGTPEPAWGSWGSQSQGGKTRRQERQEARQARRGL